MTTIRAQGLQFLMVFVATGLLWGSLAGPVQAAPLLIVNGGILDGADGVAVNGVLYNVRFRDGSCSALFEGCDDISDFTFDQAGANAASLALLQDVFTGTYDANPELTRGCTFSVLCDAYVPYGLDWSNYLVITAVAQNREDLAPDVATNGAIAMIGDTTGDTDRMFAVFTPVSTVPEPATLALLGLGCAGVCRARAPQRRRPDSRSTGTPHL